MAGTCWTPRCVAPQGENGAGLCPVCYRIVRDVIDRKTVRDTARAIQVRAFAGIPRVVRIVRGK